MKTVINVLLLVTLLVDCSGRDASPIPRNIVIMIGDGMGLGQITAGRTAKGSLELEQFTHIGLLLTQAYGDDYITDSAAAATAISTGVATFNGMIGMGPDSLPRTTILERAKALGKKTGIVTVCSITHATPASFVAHTPSREMELEIARQISQAGVDLCLGSGWGWFMPKSAGGRREDGRNLLEEMSRRGYAVVTTDSAFRTLTDLPAVNTMGLFAENHVGKARERKPTLAELTRYALETLSSAESGFVLMVEGSQIDWASHDNRSDEIVDEMVDFDDAVGEAVRFAQKHSETLIIVTADHETAGYTLLNGSVSGKWVQGGFATHYHTGVMVPLFALGPGAERFTGIRPNTDVGAILMEMLK
jgi:alkaline phosphatase